MGSRDIEHVGSAHDAELDLLKAAARQRLAPRQGELDQGVETAAAGGPLPITALRMGAWLMRWRRLPRSGQVRPRVGDGAQDAGVAVELRGLRQRAD
jgi:hypothetical protein